MNKKVVIGASLGAVAIVGVGAWILDSHGNQEPEPSASESVSSMVSDDTKSGSQVASQPEAEKEFKEIVFDGPSMVGQSDYEQLEFFKTERESYREELQLVRAYTENGPMVYATGHQVYSSPTDEYRYIISGYSPIKLFEGNIADTTFLREEDTGKRIYVFPNKTEESVFQNAWESGQRILSGKTNGDHGTIIVDGRMIPAQYFEKDGQIYFSLVPVASAVDLSLRYTEDRGCVSVRPNEFLTVQVPTNAANSEQKKVFHVAGSKFTFKSWSGESFSIDTMPVLDFDTTIISAENASKMFGWRMYTDGDVLSIVSDPLNVTNKTVIYTSGSMGLTSVLEKDENGNDVINTYDSNGTLISSTPFDVSRIDDEPAEESSEEPSEAESDQTEAESVGDDS